MSYLFIRKILRVIPYLAEELGNNPKKRNVKCNAKARTSVSAVNGNGFLAVECIHILIPEHTGRSYRQNMSSTQLQKSFQHRQSHLICDPEWLTTHFPIRRNFPKRKDIIAYHIDFKKITSKTYLTPKFQEYRRNLAPL